jgi:hypothetical protein
MGLLLVGGLLALQVLLVWGYKAAAERRIIKRSELVGSLLAAVLVAMWVGFVVILSLVFGGVE